MNTYRPERIEHPVAGDYGLVNVRDNAVTRASLNVLGWRYGHALIYAGQGELIEAWFSGVRRIALADYFPAAGPIAWYSVLDTDQDTRRGVVRYAESQLGKSYDWATWLSAPWHLTRRSTSRLARLYTIDPLHSCSGLVAKAYRAAGLNIVDRPVLSLVTPNDLDFDK